MTFAMCACQRSLCKLGVPSIEPEHEKHPRCPECGSERKVYSLTQLASALMDLGAKQEKCGICGERLRSDEANCCRACFIRG